MVDVEAFRQEVFGIVAAIPYGKVTTYGQLAWLAGFPTCSRLVGRVLRGAPATLDMPSHRVVNSQGRTVPHWREQRELLEAEGVVFKDNGCVDLRCCRWLLPDMEAEKTSCPATDRKTD